MTLKLDPKMQRMIERRVRGGKYASPEDVIRAGLAALEQQEQFGDFEPGELDALIAQGERGKGIPAEKVFAELHAAGQKIRKRRSATTRKSA
jgi:putative addiction module CopG family antidote